MTCGFGPDLRTRMLRGCPWSPASSGWVQVVMARAWTRTDLPAGLRAPPATLGKTLGREALSPAQPGLDPQAFDPTATNL